MHFGFSCGSVIKSRAAAVCCIADIHRSPPANANSRYRQMTLLNRDRGTAFGRLCGVDVNRRETGVG